MGRKGPDRHRVYPRVRGGAKLCGGLKRCLPGLSPRARGSPLQAVAQVQCGRSIPACAGEPIQRYG